MKSVKFEFPASIENEDHSGKGEITVMPMLDEGMCVISIETTMPEDPPESVEIWLTESELRQLRELISFALLEMRDDES